MEKELNAQLRSMGLYAANITGDGNCLFRALSDQLYGYPHQHAVLRQGVCDYLEARSDKFAGFIDVEKPFEEYVRSMRQSGTYGGHLELSAFAQLKQKEIKIVQPGLVYVISGDDESPQAVQERERRERERAVAQSRSVPGSEGPPPSERALRRMRRAKKVGGPEDEQASTSEKVIGTGQIGGSTAASGSTESVDEVDRQTALASSAPQPERIEAHGPLWIAYHNWEHYSSIRNADGPHTGLPRINEKRSLAANAQSLARAAHAPLDGHIASKDDTESDPEPTEEEALVMRSTRGYSLQQVRFYIKRHGGWEEALEAILANEAVVEEEEKQQSDLLRDTDEDASSELQQTVQDIRSRSFQADARGLRASDDSSERTSNSPIPDHLRDWRAVSPSSVDTAGTQSSVEGASASTHATTDGSPEAPGVKPGTSSDVRRSKRTASKDPTANLRSPKRRSRSRSPMQSDPAGTVAAHAIANIDVNSGEHTPSDRPEYTSSPLGRSDEASSESTTSSRLSRRSGMTEDPDKTPRAKMAVTPRPVTRTLTMRERREMRKADKVRRALDAKAKRQQRAAGISIVGHDDEDDDHHDENRSGLLRHHGADVKGFLELKI